MVKFSVRSLCNVRWLFQFSAILNPLLKAIKYERFLDYECSPSEIQRTQLEIAYIILYYIILWSLVYLNSVCMCIYIYKTSLLLMASILHWHGTFLSYLWLHGHTRDVQPQQIVILIIPC